LLFNSFPSFFPIFHFHFDLSLFIQYVSFSPIVGCLFDRVKLLSFFFLFGSRQTKKNKINKRVYSDDDDLHCEKIVECRLSKAFARNTSLCIQEFKFYKIYYKSSYFKLNSFSCYKITFACRIVLFVTERQSQIDYGSSGKGQP
jgi:hypothetical protein